MSVITFDDKVALRSDPSIPRVNKIIDSDINEIKNSVNALYTGAGGSNIFVQPAVITSAEILTGNTSPVSIISSPGATTLLQPVAISFKLNYVSVEYASNLNIVIRWSSTVVNVASVSGFLSGTQDKYIIVSPGVANGGVTSTSSILEGKDIEFAVSTGDPINGNSYIQLNIFYTKTDFSLIT
jgi:hypothetical protein